METIVIFDQEKPKLDLESKKISMNLVSWIKEYVTLIRTNS